MPIVGKSVPRLDAIEKVTGRAVYVDDIDMPGMWHGAVVRACIPHGRLRRISLDPAFDWSRVVTADARDIRGRNCVAMIEDDLPLIVTDVVKHVGEAIMLIAAPSRELALEARRHVKAECEEWEPVLSIEDSKAARIKIRGDDNVISRYEIHRGDVDKGFAASDLVIEGTYTAGYQEHIYIEMQGMVAAMRDDGKLSVTGSLQCPYYVSRALAIIMDMPEERISVRQAAVGGAFGGKEDYPSVIAGFAAVLAAKCGRPVKIIYDRDEDIEATTKRHPAIVRHRTGVARDGTLKAMDISFELDGGAYVTLTPVVLSRGFIHSPGPYRCDNVRAVGCAYCTNTSPNGAFRGFGAPQAIFPIEVHMDRIAAALGLSPLEIRRRNLLHEGDSTATGQILNGCVGASEVIEAAAKRSNFARRWSELAKPQQKNLRRGIGIALFQHGSGFTGSGEAKLKGEAGLRLDPDGKICVLTACTEMGQGSHTVLPQMAADHLGVDLECVSIETPDTALVPDSGPTVASRTTMVMGVVLGKCAEGIKEKLFAFAAKRFGADKNKLSFKGLSLMSGKKSLVSVDELVRTYLAERGPLTVIDHYDLPPGIHWDDEKYEGDAYPTYAWGCDVAEVEVDLDTFDLRVDKMWMAAEIGRAVNPQLSEGQIEGGTIQALGWAVMEKLVMDRGHVRTNRLQTYVIPTSMDMPEMDTIIIEKPYAYGPMGAKGVGELPMDGGAPAIANAVAQATGLSVRDLPITPERLYEEWRRCNGK